MRVNGIFGGLVVGLLVGLIKPDNFQLISVAVRFVSLLMLPSRGLDQLVFSGSHRVKRQEQPLGWQAVAERS